MVEDRNHDVAAVGQGSLDGEVQAVRIEGSATLTIDASTKSNVVETRGRAVSGLLIMSAGLGAVFVGVTTAAQAGVPADKAGLAAALINTSTWLGGALGIAVFSAISTSRAHNLIAGGASLHEALTSGFQRALVACAIAMLTAGVIALRATNTRGEPEAIPIAEPGDDAVPAVDFGSSSGSDSPLGWLHG